MSGKLVVGLDLGINNVGWAVVRRAEAEVAILAQGTFVFDSPLADENKPGEGLKTKIRGMKRRSRITGQRRRKRKMGLYHLLAEHGFLPRKMNERVEYFCRNIHPTTGVAINPYALRAAALERALTAFELGRALSHLNQKRGFYSPRDLMAQGAFRVETDLDAVDTKDAKAVEEAKGIKLEVAKTKEEMKDFPTIGAYLYDRLKRGEPVRKTTLQAQLKKAQKGKGDKEKKALKAHFDKLEKENALRRFVRPDRHMIRDEFEAIIQEQRKHHPILTDNLIEQIRAQIFHQELLRANKSARGTCTFFKKELRAPRASLRSQKFALAQELAHLEVMENRSPVGEADSNLFEAGPASSTQGVFRRLTAPEIQTLLNELMEGRDLTWNRAKELIGLPTTALFSREPDKEKGKKKKVTQKSGTKEYLRGSQTVERIRKVIPEKWDQLGEDAQDNLVGEIVSIRDWTLPKGSKRNAHDRPAAIRRRALFLQKEYGPNRVTFTEQEANELATVPLPEGYMSLSNRAIRKIMPYLMTDKAALLTTEEGEELEVRGPMVYSMACTCAGFNHADSDGERPTLDRLPYPSDSDIPHAVVRTSVRSAVRILNAIHRKFGKPDAIHIELPRDLAMGADARAKIEQAQSDNEKTRQRIIKDLIAIKVKPTRQNIQKVQLWEELGGGPLPYEPDITVPDLKALFFGDFEIEHIVPKSHALDSRMSNLTLATRAFNTQVKGNRTLWEAIGQSDPARWRMLEAHIRGIRSIPLHKRNRMLAKERPEDFTGRHLAATGYISKEVHKLAQLMVVDKTQVLVVSGSATGFLRREWGFENLVPLHPEEQAIVDEWKAFIEKAEDGKATDEDIPKQAPANKNRSNFKHHSVDALVVALTDKASLQALTTYAQLEEHRDPRLADDAERKRLRASVRPDPNLRDKAKASTENAVVVHRPRRRPSGELHKQQPEEGALQGIAQGEPWSSCVVGKYLVRFDQNGTPSQAYPLGSNHHVVIWERTEPNKKGVYERCGDVVPTIEAVRRLSMREPVITKVHPEPGWKFVMALCKGDLVEMADGAIGVVSRFSTGESKGSVDLALWFPHVANQLGKINPENPYLLCRLRSCPALLALGSRVVMNPLGEIVYREGAEE